MLKPCDTLDARSRRPRTTRRASSVQPPARKLFNYITLRYILLPLTTPALNLLIPLQATVQGPIVQKPMKGDEPVDAIQPIQPGPIGGTTRPTAAPDVRPTVAGPAFASPFGSTARPGGIGSEVQALLREIGGGVQNNEALQMLITLMIFLALLQAAQGGGSSASEDSFKMLEALAKNGTAQGSSAALYYEQTTISMTTATVAAAFNDTASSSGANLDIQG